PVAVCADFCPRPCRAALSCRGRTNGLGGTPMREMLLALVVAGLAFGAAPPAKLTPEQRKLQGECGALWNAGLRAWDAGKQAEAIAALERALELQRRVSGPWHRGTDLIADKLGDFHQARGEWAKEAKCRRVVVESRRALLGEGRWPTVDARLELAE